MRRSLARSLFVRAYGWACERLYHELAWAYEAAAWTVSAGRWDGWRRLALEQAQGRVLELGFGPGALLAEGGRRGLNMVGLEPSSAMQRQAARRLAAAGVRPPRVQGRSQALPFAGAAFDTVLSTFPAGYIFSPATAREVARVLRPGGRLVVVGPWVRLTTAAQPGLFYGAPAPGIQALFAETLAAAGLASEWREAADGPARVGVVIATRDGSAGDAGAPGAP